jgi:hypothetical protein
MAPPPEDPSRDQANRPDPSELAETIADAPAIRRKAGKPSSLPAPKKEPDPALDDTAVDTDADDDSDDSAAEVDMEGIYDRPEAVAAADMASLHRYDPEAGRSSVAVKVRAVTEAVKNSVATPFGKLIVTLPVLLVGTGLTIAAINIQDTPFIVAASVVMPIALLLVYWRYQIWLGHKRYMYRLLESLGEDMSDYDPRKVFRRAGTKSMKRGRGR